MKLQWIGAALGVVLAGAAVAQDSEMGEDEIAQDTVVTQDMEREDRTDLTGLAVKIGGGVEGYTGNLNDVTNVGPNWGLSVNLQPTRFLGVEVGYSGATTDAASELYGDDGLTGGPDIIRNGAQAALILGVPTAIQPYVLGGIGFDYYSVRDSDVGATQFNDDASGAFPLGAGLRTNRDGLSADLRFTYNALFSDDFAGQTDNGFGDGRYAATLQVGGKF